MSVAYSTPPFANIPEQTRHFPSKNVTNIAERITGLSQQIRGLEQDYGREADTVELLAVSKRHSAESIRQAAAAGLVNFGENYLQEALEKIVELKDLPLVWHFIGPIQSNKTRGIAEHFHWVHSIERGKIAERLSAQRPSELEPLNVCIQVNLSGEDSKSGIELEQATDLCATVAPLPNLRLRGLMAIPAPEENFDRQRACFAELSTMFQQLQTRFETMDTLSMVMSNDFEAAIAEGSTMIRIGTAIFGPRD